jgi:hypothetical protein
MPGYLRIVILFDTVLWVVITLLLRYLSNRNLEHPGGDGEWRLLGCYARVAHVRTDVTKELYASIIRVTRIGELGTTLAVTSNRRTLRRNTSVRRLLVTASVVPSSPILATVMIETQSSCVSSVLIRATRRNIPQDAILHSHRRENLKSYISSWGFGNLCAYLWTNRLCEFFKNMKSLKQLRCF